MLVMDTGLFYCETPLGCSNSVTDVGVQYFHAQVPVSYGAQARHTVLFFHLTRSRISQENLC
jgi:hypothetical protein